MGAMPFSRPLCVSGVDHSASNLCPSAMPGQIRLILGQFLGSATAIEDIKYYPESGLGGFSQSIGVSTYFIQA